LILRIASKSPHLVIYPIIATLNSSEEEEVIQSVQQILASIEAGNPELVSQVQVLIGELLRITFLWEEQWLSALQHAQSELSSKVKHLKSELLKLKSDSTTVQTEQVIFFPFFFSFFTDFFFFLALCVCTTAPNYSRAVPRSDKVHRLQPQQTDQNDAST
jgi:hypothetical protein